MKTTFALAFVMFMLYLAGCDFVSVEPGTPTDMGTLKEQISEPPLDYPEDMSEPYYVPMMDTVKK
jgi:hypothetical protein